MRYQLTPAGEHAYAVAQRAFDQQITTSQALDEISLIRTDDQRSAQEVHNALAMVTRLASSQTSPARTISDQIGGAIS